MKPRALITESIKNTLVKDLSDIGFAFSEKSLIFKRKSEGFIQSVSFSLRKYNAENYSAEFWLMFGVESPFYTNWHKKEYQQKPVNNALAGEADWNIPGWSYPQYPVDGTNASHFQIIDEGYRPLVLQKLKENVLQLGVPFLEDFSNWENAANHLVLKGWFHHKACDFFFNCKQQGKSLLGSATRLATLAKQATSLFSAT